MYVDVRFRFYLYVLPNIMINDNTISCNILFPFDRVNKNLESKTLKKQDYYDTDIFF